MKYIKSRLVNVNNYIYGKVYFPVQSNSLKNIGGFIGASWASEGATVVKPNRRLMDALPEETEWPEWSPDNRYLAFIYRDKLAFADTTIIGLPEEWRPGQFDPP